MKNVVAAIQIARDSGPRYRRGHVSLHCRRYGACFRASTLVADGGVQKLFERLKDPAIRARIKKDLAGDHPDWENSSMIAAALRGFSSPLPKTRSSSTSPGKRSMKLQERGRNLRRSSTGDHICVAFRSDKKSGCRGSAPRCRASRRLTVVCAGEDYPDVATRRQWHLVIPQTHRLRRIHGGLLRPSCDRDERDKLKTL